MTTTTTITRPVPHATEFDRYYTVAQAAALLGVSRVSVWRWIRDGQLPAQRLGQRTTRIKREDVDLLRGAVTPAQDVDHTVQFYEDDAVVLNAAAAFIGAGLGAGDVGIVVVTQPHREGIAARLCAAGIDVSSAVAEGRYIA
ncbi:MAG: helix-turn-helix domain-containing protein, partial [Chloroflexota bacterium]|nr:helix-turn-helix domain-containing protein [Chloroflexota bacterium]